MLRLLRRLLGFENSLVSFTNDPRHRCAAQHRFVRLIFSCTWIFARKRRPLGVFPSRETTAARPSASHAWGGATPMGHTPSHGAPSPRRSVQTRQRSKKVGNPCSFCLLRWGFDGLPVLPLSNSPARGLTCGRNRASRCGLTADARPCRPSNITYILIRSFRLVKSLCAILPQSVAKTTRFKGRKPKNETPQQRGGSAENCLNLPV